MNDETFEAEIEAHRDRVRLSMSAGVVIDRIKFLVDNPAEMLAFEQTLIAMGTIASSMADDRTRIATLDVGCLASCIAVRPEQTLKKLKAISV